MVPSGDVYAKEYYAKGRPSRKDSLMNLSGFLKTAGGASRAHPEQRPTLEQVPMLLQAPGVHAPLVQAPLAQAPPGHWESNVQERPAFDPPLQAMPHCDAKVQLDPGSAPPTQTLPHWESKLQPVLGGAVPPTQALPHSESVVQVRPGVGPPRQLRPHWESKLQLVPGLGPPRQALPHWESVAHVVPGVGPPTQVPACASRALSSIRTRPSRQLQNKEGGRGMDRALEALLMMAILLHPEHRAGYVPALDSGLLL